MVTIEMVTAAPPTGKSAAVWVTGQALSIVGALMLCLVVQIAVIGQLAHNRDQDRAYAAFRDQLANATAPAGGRVLHRRQHGSGRLIGNFRCHGAKFLDCAWFSGTSFAEHVDFTATTFAGRPQELVTEVVHIR
ncbi:hypothetical protein QRX50_21820 [Amycolatopsis carbonis]|uniref:Uncharacterized protein n=1 Tax=Amycolatopsis carbonis TaxID=715471 RepID=A0A9Y2IR20_9PSEU|nr:hypothetical protein [Amycolatopsis sp. 2-15]WIX83208.1 hypothetical protein QRX50_21820 [Amycolatopsis sp. 2-15]